ncbi:piggyBac transposable element-derived protein 4 isoform X24 [Acanthochromis polyacanthus]|uniref:piggyBac transposable element-derived protein 4 isoform X17 n=1 Tax=Acanthochromis polyacanthus TaxID=80966 RepID=UPI0022347EF8|nr:piggyBac transposable element-derived protein 4 isoform X17 [Acanthochromis polyacanthus]XP_051814417.1 piggyBac transposable element-derived protein 4 isoform X22 [Acanthochromis polyacanthus]XP_051814419.1 piggyBac transposable element-derived protein 4 isoform X24 [Acanthochromis polyacanthus]
MHRRSKVFCALCQRSEETKITGALSTKDEVTAHEHCLLFSSGICCESSPEVDDLFGFSVEDVLDEVERGDKLICHYCKKKGATAGCEVKRCKKSYHYPCAVQDGAKTIEDEQNGCYGLYCLKHYSQQQSNSTAGSPSVHSNDSSSSGRTIRTARKRPLSESEKQEESPSKRRTGDWNGMVSADPSDSAENETKPESDIILPLKSDLDESANSVPEDQFLHLSTVTQAIRQEESPSKRRTGDWNGMVSADPSDSAENETKPESEIILPLKSDLDESANNVPEDQFLHLPTVTQAIRQSDEPRKDKLEEDGEVSPIDSEAEEFLLEGKDITLDIPSSQSDEDWEPSTAGVHGQEDSTSGEEETIPLTPAKSPKRCSGRGRGRGRGRGERRRTSPSPIDQASTSGERWNDVDVPDIEPPQIIFCPNRTPGPQLIMTENYTPVKLFQLFFSNDVLLTIVKNTNEHGSAHYSTPSKPWTNIDLQDMFSFISVLIYMGVVKCSSYTDYWRGSNLYSLQFPKRVMAGRKFLRMIWALHLNSAAMDAENEGRRGTAAFDRLGKIKPLYDEMREACKRNYHPNQEIAIDERMVASKARIGLKQYMKSKPVRWGYKLFVLADSKAGYTWDFFVYEGKSTVNTGKGIRYESVMELLKPQLLGTGYKLFVDNFYTSTTLFQDLLKMKVWACGTIRSNLIGFPRTTENSLDSKSHRGSVRWIRKDSLLFVQWRDTRDVSLCSTFHRAHTGETIKRRVRSADGQWEVKDITLPPVVKDYNQHMGGVDLSDALIQFYKVLHKTRKWYKTFFYHFVDIAIVNAFLIHKELAMAKGQVPMNQKAFRETLAEDLAMMGSAPPNKPVRGPAPAPVPAPAPARAKHHRITYISGDSTAGRLKCKNCRKKTPVKCATCDVSLCFLAGRDCYNDWHVANKFWK